MPLFRRSDGDFVKKSSLIRKMMPYIMKGRNESAVYFEQQIDMTNPLRYIEKINKDSSIKYTLFHLILYGVGKAISLRPETNRFIIGRRLYQRKNIELSFAVKKEFTDEAPMTAIKIIFDPAESFLDFVKRVYDLIKFGKGEKKTTSEKEMGLITRLPRFLIRLLVWLQEVLDYFNLLPASMLKNDPMYASIFLANIGSIGLEAPFHHLYEYGTIPFFAVVGRMKKVPIINEQSEIAVREAINIRYTFDERITDGFYCGKSLEIFKDFFENPEKLIGC